MIYGCSKTNEPSIDIYWWEHCVPALHPTKTNKKPFSLVAFSKYKVNANTGFSRLPKFGVEGGFY